MKRIGNLYSQICDIGNLKLADSIARKGKLKQFGVKLHDSNKESNIIELHNTLIQEKYKTSEYSTFKIWEPKERDVFRLPYYPDRICQHAIINILKPYFVSMFVKDTYSCIEGRGVHKAATNLKEVLKDEIGTKYCLKLDILKFYLSVDHDILKNLLRKKFKDKKVLCLLDEIIDSAPGVPIGNFLSQYLSNFYLNYFDHWIKEDKAVKYYFRYADDVIILSDDKYYLHNMLCEIKIYLSVNLKLEVKGNHQVFPTRIRGVDFLGYVFFGTHTKLRKSIKKNYIRKLKTGKASRETIASYNGWIKHCNSRHLLKKLIPHERNQIQRTRNKNNKPKLCWG